MTRAVRVENDRAGTRAAWWRSVIAGLLICTGGLSFPSGCSKDSRGTESFPMGREVIRDPALWWCRSNDMLIVYAQNPESLKDASDAISFSRRKAESLIGIESNAEQTICYYLIRDDALWKELSTKYAIHTNTVSLTAGNEVICLIHDRETLTGDAIPHEMIHVVIHQSGLHLPLALEEGMALYFGWEINLEYHLSRGNIVQKKKNKLNSESLLAVDDLFQVSSYPQNPSALDAFYVQSERYIQAVHTLIGTAMIPDFLRKAEQGGRPWRDILAVDYQCSSDQLAWVERVTARPIE